MKLFKNRGDIYIPKSVTGKNKQAKILYILLIFVVLFTIVFVALVGHKYPSAASFFGEGEVTVSQKAVPEDEKFPKISGKKNFLVIETDDSNSYIHYMFLLQADKDNLAYKACALAPNMLLGEQKVSDIYSLGGGAALESALSEYLGINIDYYTQFETASFVEFANKLGSFIYNSDEKIRYSGGKDDDKYTIHLDEGEQKIKGRDITNLLRYYSSEKENYEAENELILRAVSQLMNEDNLEKSEQLFRLLVSSSVTDITVRDFEKGKDSITVYCKKNSDVTLYSALAKYENGNLTQQSLQEIKGYFTS
jgi:hypothetical protein